MQLRVTSMSGARAVITIDPATASVEEVAGLVARELALPAGRLKLVAKGQPLSAAMLRQLQDGDSILAMVAPRPPPQELRQLAQGGEAGGEEEDDLERFRLPAGAPAWQRALARFLQRRLRLPDMALVLLFSLRPRFWLGLVAWMVGAKAAAAYDLGPLFMVTTVFVLILGNLGQRREGEASAYSIFNNFQRLPGQLTAEHMDDQVRRGHMG